MKTYKVFTSEHRYYVNDVKAKNYEEAISKVEHNDNSFDDIADNSWETTAVEEIDKTKKPYKVSKTWELNPTLETWEEK